MRRLLETLAISMFLFATACATMDHGQIAFGIRLAEPPAPRAYYVPPQPGLDYEWIEGYWYWQGSRYVWHDGYWTLPPYPDAYWIAPYYTGGLYFSGHWEGRRGNVVHDHRWDRSRQRDERRGPGRDERRR